MEAEISALIWVLLTQDPDGLNKYSPGGMTKERHGALWNIQPSEPPRLREAIEAGQRKY